MALTRSGKKSFIDGSEFSEFGQRSEERFHQNVPVFIVPAHAASRSPGDMRFSFSSTARTVHSAKYDA